MDADRRAVPRTITTVPIETFDAGPPLQARDIGLGGMLVTTDRPRWPGTLIRVRFKLPQQQRAIRATCRVVDLVPQDSGVGLALTFLKLAPEAQQAIARFVDERPLPDYADLSIASKVSAWIERMVEDCKQLKALAQV